MCVGGDNGVEIINQIKSNKYVYRSKIVGVDTQKRYCGKKIFRFLLQNT